MNVRPNTLFDEDFFSLAAPVGPDQPNRREDVIKVETILGNTGHHDLAKTDGPLGFWGEDHDKAVKSWQGENGLKMDGLLKPGGPTITSLRKSTGGLLGGLKPATPDEVDEHHSRLAQGEPPLLNIRPARLSLPKPPQPVELDEASQAFNADSARALTRSIVDGDVPRIYASYVKEAGVADAHPTVMDLVEQVNATSGRDRADRLLHGIIGGLPADQAKALLGTTPPATRPLGVRVADLPDDDKVPLFLSATDATEEGKTDAQSQQASTDEQVAMAPAVVAGGAAMAAGTAAVLGKQLPEAIENTRKWWENRQQPEGENGQKTTATDPQAGEPQVLPGADPTQPRPQQGTPPSQPPKPVPPVPPSMPQKPPTEGSSVPGRPAQPVKPMEPLEIKPVAPIDHSKGGKPHPTTQQGLEQIPDQDARKSVEKVVLSGGITNGADNKATNVQGAGDYETAKQAQADLARHLGVDPRQIKPFANGQPGAEFSTPDGRLTIGVRPSSRSEAPTLEVQVKDENGNLTYRIKRRYMR